MLLMSKGSEFLVILSLFYGFAREMKKHMSFITVTFYCQQHRIADLPFTSQRIYCHTRKAFDAIIRPNVPYIKVIAATRYDISST